jgi:hypothetical protein
MFTTLSKRDRLDILNEAEVQRNVSGQAIEKDWWVCAVLQVLFSSQYQEYLAFKGGTSLSKGWNMIDRASEDIDIAIDRDFLGYGGELSKSQISNRLRRASCAFVRGALKETISKGLASMGVPQSQYNVVVEESPVSTVDPEKIYIEYESVYDQEVVEYVKSRVIVEAGARSIFEPISAGFVSSFLSELSLDPDGNSPVPVNLVPAERTFLEKAFLLHEEFSKPVEQIRTERMSRHLYDLERMMNSSVAHAIYDIPLYYGIIEHRKRFIGLKDFSYESLRHDAINFTPPQGIQSKWEKDYQSMRTYLIFGPSLPYGELLVCIKELNERFRSVTALPK